MENLNLYVSLSDGLLEPETTELYDVILSRACTLRELIDYILKLPTNGTLDIDETKSIHFRDGVIYDEIHMLPFSSEVKEVSARKRPYTTHFRILTTQADVKPLSVSFKQTSPTGGDESAAYIAEFSRECTLNELVNLLLTHTGSWGAIYYQGRVAVEYKFGKLEYISARWKEQFGDEKIKSCKASGGWGQMNYYIG